MEIVKFIFANQTNLWAAGGLLALSIIGISSILSITFSGFASIIAAARGR